MHEVGPGFTQARQLGAEAAQPFSLPVIEELELLGCGRHPLDGGARSLKHPQLDVAPLSLGGTREIRHGDPERELGRGRRGSLGHHLYHPPIAAAATLRAVASAGHSHASSRQEAPPSPERNSAPGTVT